MWNIKNNTNDVMTITYLLLLIAKKEILLMNCQIFFKFPVASHFPQSNWSLQLSKEDVMTVLVVADYFACGVRGSNGD